MLASPHELRNFIEAARVGNLTRAAQRLGIAQPSLTQSLQSLEKKLGTQLLIRERRGVTLTRSGKRVLARAEELLAAWSRVELEALEEEDAVQGRFTIGCHPSVAQYTLPSFLPKLFAERPKLEIHLKHDLSRRVVDLVINREIDLGIAVNPVKHPDLVIIPLCEDIFGFWHSPKQRSSDVVLCDPELSQVQWLLARAGKAGLKYSQVVPCQSLEVIAQLSASGAGYCLLPSRVAGLYRARGLAPVDMDLPEYKDKVCVVYRADALRSKAGKFLVGAIREGMKA